MLTERPTFSPPRVLRNGQVQTAIGNLPPLPWFARRRGAMLLASARPWVLDCGDGVRLQGLLSLARGLRRPLGRERGRTSPRAHRGRAARLGRQRGFVLRDLARRLAARPRIRRSAAQSARSRREPPPQPRHLSFLPPGRGRRRDAGRGGALSGGAALLDRFFARRQFHAAGRGRRGRPRGDRRRGRRVAGAGSGRDARGARARMVPLPPVLRAQMVAVAAQSSGGPGRICPTSSPSCAAGICVR